MDSDATAAPAAPVTAPDKGLGTRDRLLEAAIALIESGGEAAVRVDAVSTMAEVTRPSLYHFFGDREGLIIAAQAERYRRSLMFGMAEQTRAVEACTTREQLVEVIGAWMSNLGSPEGEARRRVRVEVLGSSVSRPELRQVVHDVDERAAHSLGSMLTVAQQRGWLSMPFDLDVAGLWWFGMMNGRYMVEGPCSSLVRREWDAIAQETVLRLLFGAPSAWPGGAGR